MRRSSCCIRLPELEIERAERLVQKQHLGPHDEGAGERDALLLAAGELVDPTVGQLFEAHQADDLAHPLVDLGAVDLRDAEPVSDVLAHVHVREESEALEHHVGGPAFRPEAGHVGAVDLHCAGGGGDEAPDHAQQGGLAAPGRAEYREEIARVDLEVERAHRLHRAEALGEAPQPHQDGRGRCCGGDGVHAFSKRSYSSIMSSKVAWVPSASSGGMG